MTVISLQRTTPATALSDRYFSYLQLSDRQLETELRAVVRAEHELPEPLRYEATLERLRAWLELSPEDARIIARAYAEALRTYPASYAREAQEAERSVLLNGMTFDEFKRLAGILPWLRDDSWLPCEDPQVVERAA